MRLLVECPQCRRQYDASRRPIGSRLRCTCGHVIVIQKPEGHDAQAVRCSACRAARTDECGGCAGLWLGHESFRELVERAKKESLPAGTIPETPQQEAAKFRLPAGAHVAAPPPGASFYRPCAVCREFMRRVNYGHASGVI